MCVRKESLLEKLETFIIEVIWVLNCNVRVLKVIIVVESPEKCFSKLPAQGLIVLRVLIIKAFVKLCLNGLCSQIELLSMVEKIQSQVASVCDSLTVIDKGHFVVI